MNAPQWFVRLLELLDPYLSVRWGDSIQQWVIERKSVIPNVELEFLKRRLARTQQIVNNPQPNASEMNKRNARNTLLGLIEENTSASSGKRIIFFTRELTQETYNFLCQSDIKRYGGYARFADELEQMESRQAADSARVRDNKLHALNQEVWGMLDHIWRKKEDKLLNGERDMFRLLHGRERKEGEQLIELTDV